MTDEELRKMARSNYAVQMEMNGYDNSGNPLDVVRVVRCRDCKHGRPCKGYTEPYIECLIKDQFSEDRHNPENWYCADGERR